MRPEYYADLFRRYATFCPDLSGNRLVRVACGPGGFDQNWTRTVVDRAGDRMQAISVHYYTVWPEWNNKTPATGFGEAEWFAILRGCLDMRRAIRESEEVMERRGERGRRRPIELYVDEWGSWYRGERGTPGYALYQQNSLRDAILAGLTFHIFHEHNESVKMANIAQTVNVLQAMILTKGDKMLLTPTYHVFQMYKVHQDATRLPVKFESPEYKFEDRSMPAMSVSASRSTQGDVNVSIVNAHAKDDIELTCELPGIKAAGVAGRILTSAKLDAHNTFEDPEHIRPTEFKDASIKDGKLTAKIPAHSVVVLTLAD
jgi:alpha-N-arabinofuranosidase